MKNKMKEEVASMEDLPPAETVPATFLERCANTMDWVFGAFAELTDNSVDAGAKNIRIDVLTDLPQPVKPVDRPYWSGKAIVVEDDGEGISFETLQKMVRPYVSTKDAASKSEIGRFGIGVKSGTMRISYSALFIAIREKECSCALLSQTYLKDSKSAEYRVPICHWKLGEKGPSDPEEVKNLHTILAYTPYSTLELLLEEFNTLATRSVKDKSEISGLRINLFELKPRDVTDSETTDTELDFSVGSDVQIVATQEDRSNSGKGPEQFSLREYMSILYLQPSYRIYIRDKKVRLRQIADGLYKKDTMEYQPLSNPITDSVSVTFGLHLENKDLCGLMVYHKNRLILRYHRLDKIHSNNKSSKYMGILCVLDTPFLEANPMKNDFLKEGKQYASYQHLMNWMTKNMKTYWKKCKIDVTDGGEGIRAFWKRAEGVSMPTRIQCDSLKCLRWEKIPDTQDISFYADNWSCTKCQREQGGGEWISDSEEVQSEPEEVIEDTPSKSKKKTKSKKSKKKKDEDEELILEDDEKPKKKRKKKGKEEETPATTLPLAQVSGLITLEEARLMVLRHDLEHIELHIPFNLFLPEWRESRDSWVDHVMAAASHKTLGTCLVALEKAVGDEYKLPPWADYRAEWIDKCRNCPSIEVAQELQNDLEYFCFDYKKMEDAEHGRLEVNTLTRSKTRSKDVERKLIEDQQQSLSKSQRTIDSLQKKLNDANSSKKDLESKLHSAKEEIKNLKAGIVPAASEESTASANYNQELATLFKEVKDMLVKNGAQSKQPALFENPFEGYSNAKQLIMYSTQDDSAKQTFKNWFQLYNALFTTQTQDMEVEDALKSLLGGSQQ